MILNWNCLEWLFYGIETLEVALGFNGLALCVFLFHSMFVFQNNSLGDFFKGLLHKLEDFPELIIVVFIQQSFKPFGGN